MVATARLPVAQAAGWVVLAKLASIPPANHMQRVSPNLIVVLHYASKAFWLILAAVFGIIGFQLYAIGVQATRDATANLPLGISFSLHDAGPGLVVMVIALLCSLVGFVKDLRPRAYCPRAVEQRCLASMRAPQTFTSGVSAAFATLASVSILIMREWVIGRRIAAPPNIAPARPLDLIDKKIEKRGRCQPCAPDLPRSFHHRHG